MNLTVVIAQRNEPELKRTIDCVLASCGDDLPQILVVNDGDQPGKKGRPRKGVRVITPWHGGAHGCQPARDAGIMAADTDCVAIIDGHMDFEAGTFATMLEHVESHPREIVCARCCHLDMPGWNRSTYGDYSGAYLLWLDGRVPLSPKWRDVETPDIVPCVLGACYMFRRDRYVDALRRPWRSGTGWGRDEEILSIANWLCGGENRVIDKRCWHWFRDAKHVPYDTNAATLAGVLTNHWRLVQMLPLSDSWRKELEAALFSDPMFKSQLPRIREKMAACQEDVDAMRLHLSAHERTMAEWRALYCCDGDPRPKHGGDIRNRPGYMQPKKADGHTAPIPRQQFIGQRQQPKLTPCPKNEQHSVRLLRKYPNGNLQMQCTDCNRQYIVHAKH